MAQQVHLALKIDGNDIVGESEAQTLDRANTIECSAFYHGISVPYEHQDLSLTGRKQHQVIRVIKKVDHTTAYKSVVQGRNSY